MSPHRTRYLACVLLGLLASLAAAPPADGLAGAVAHRGAAGVDALRGRPLAALAGVAACTFAQRIGTAAPRVRVRSRRVASPSTAAKRV